jgi:hypothetical protein
MTALSVSASLKDLDANLILAHGEDDDLIPFTETLRLAQAAPNFQKVHCQILKIFSHVDPEQMPWTMKNLISFYLPEGWKLFRVVYQLMSYRRAEFLTETRFSDLFSECSSGNPNFSPPP